jgi:transcriptional regulator with XRE-family HTH domain
MKAGTHIPLPKAVSDLLHHVSISLPSATHTANPGGVRAGNWWLEFKCGRRSATVEWRPQRGFGVYDPANESYGAGPKEVFRSAQMSSRRLVQLLSASAASSSWLTKLRELHGVSQIEVAKRLNIRQGNISKLERRSKVQLATVVNLVAALGGSIEIRAKFPEGEFPLELGTLAQAEPIKSAHKKPGRPPRAKIAA